MAVDDFNMGAMENKSLNIFNSRLVSPAQASDLTCKPLQPGLRERATVRSFPQILAKAMMIMVEHPCGRPWCLRLGWTHPPMNQHAPLLSDFGKGEIVYAQNISSPQGSAIACLLTLRSVGSCNAWLRCQSALVRAHVAVWT